MFSWLESWQRAVLSLLLAFIVSYVMVPQVKKFAESIGAIDKPNPRRINKEPVPRMGGIAIFCGFMLSALLFAELTDQVKGILAGCALIAVMGGLDDVFNLNAWVKLTAQIGAAIICVSCGVVLDGLTNFLGSGETVYYSQWVSGLITVLWIVGCTNAINLIDGLDGLAVGMSAISAGTLFVISLGVETATANVSVLLLCLIGACVGFWPYNKHPAKIFMGDVGSQMLGFLLGTISIIGIFKMHALVTMLVPFMAMAVPLADTAYAFIRRVVKGQSPFHPDRGHLHHRLLALGLSQKQAVAVMYGISAVLGLSAVLMTGKSPLLRIGCLVLAFGISITVWLYVFRDNPKLRKAARGNEEKAEQSQE